MSDSYQFIATHARQYPIAVLCRVLGVSRSGYYAWRTRPTSQRRQADGQLEAQIRQVHAASRRTYGSPRVHAELRDQGVRCSEQRIARLMRRAGIRACRPRRRRRTPDSCHTLPVAANLLNREFAAPAANTKWAADITYIETGAGWYSTHWRWRWPSASHHPARPSQRPREPVCQRRLSGAARGDRHPVQHEPPG
jgi:transposase InsO family protein